MLVNDARNSFNFNEPFIVFRFMGWVLLIFVLFKDFLTAEPFNLGIRVRYIDDAIIVICYFLGIYYGLIYRNRAAFIFSCFLCLFFIYGLFVSGSFVSSILGIRDYVWYLGLSILGVSSVLCTRSAYKIVYQIEVWAKCFIVIQLYVCLMQIIFLTVFKGEFFIEDRLTGTLGYGQAHVLGYSLLLAVAICYKRLSRVYLGAVIICLFVGSVRLGILAMVISFLSVLLISEIRLRNKIFIILSGMVFLFFLFSVYNIYQSRATLDVSTLIAQHTQEVDYRWAFEGTRKVSMMVFVTSFFETFLDWIFGFGPSSFGSRGAEYTNAPLMMEFDRLFDFENDLITGGMQWMSTFVEYGIFGVCVWFVVPAFYFLNTAKKCSMGAFFGFMVLILVSFGNRVLDPYAISFFTSVLLLYVYCLRGLSEVKI